MGVPILTPPLVGHTPAIADEVMALLDKIVTELDGQIDRDNLQDGEVIGSKLADGAVTNAKVSDTAGIAFSKLGPLLDGQMVFGHTTAGVGVPEAKTVSGLATVDNTGKLIASVGFDVGAATGLPIDNTTYSPIAGLSRAVLGGSYLLAVQVTIQGTGMNVAKIRARTSTAVVIGDAVHNAGASDLDEITLTIVRQVAIAGSVTVLVDSTTGAVPGPATAVAGTMLLWRTS